ncbi:glycerol-3-phosphate phosphatase-like [Styela clava]
MSTIINADSQEIASKIIKENDFFLFDCDGVLWTTGHIYPGAAEVIHKLHALGKRVLFVTNNSTKTRQQYYEKIIQYQIEASLEDIFCTSYTTALYLKHHVKKGEKVYIMGSSAVAEELENVGIESFGVGPDNSIISLDSDFSKPLEKNVKAVVTAFDGYFSYAKIIKAASYIAKEGTIFAATNMDAQFPLKNSEYKLPGTGALVKSVITAVGHEPDVICGKPDSVMFDCIKEGTDIDCNKAIMIGDRLDTDILFGKNNNLQTLAVMTGVTTHQKLNEIQQSTDPEIRKLIPQYYLESIADLGKYL